MSQKEILRRNFEAIKLAHQIINENVIPTDSELAVLNKFSGWGGVKSVLYPITEDWSNLRNISQDDLAMEKEVKEFYHYIKDNIQKNSENPKKQNIWLAIQEATRTSFYTPTEAIEELFVKLKENNPHITSMLDPSAGSGRFVDAFVSLFPKAEVTAIEIDYLTSMILKAKYMGNERVHIINSGFEEVDFKNKKFDIVASNIPFGNFKVSYPAYENQVTDKIHNFFFYHGINLLNDGGLLMYITSSGVFNSPSNTFIRKEIFSLTHPNCLLSLPNNFFENTEVASQLYIGQKTSSASHPDVIDLKPDENNIYVNPLSEYLVPEEKVILGTNPYGNPEYNYKLPLERTLQEIRERLDISQLEIQRVAEEIDNSIRCERYPIGFELLDNIDFQRELDLLRIDISSEEQKQFSAVGVIKACYKGTTIPVATVCRLSNGNSKQYLIDTYITNTNLYKPEKKFLDPKEFIREFDFNFIPSLEQLCRDYNLQVFTDIRNNDIGNNFCKYFFDKFTQPYLSTTYTTGIRYSFHRAPERNMLILNDSGNPAKINDIFVEKHGNTIYELEELHFTNAKQQNLIKDYFLLYSIYNDYIGVLNEDNKDNEYNNRVKIYNQKLNSTYDIFVSKYGYINENRLLINKYDTFFYSILSTLEKVETQNIDLFTSVNRYKKADIFTIPQEEIIQGLQPQEALVSSLGKFGQVKLDYMSEITGLTEQELYVELKERIIYNPIENKYDLREIFLSGDIYDKIEKIEQLESTEESINAIEELQKVIPSVIPYYSIDKQFGSRWIPLDVYKDFLKQHFTADFALHYDPSTDVFTVGKGSNVGNKYVFQRFKSSRYITPELIIENAFYDVYPIVTYEETLIDGQKITQTDRQATEYYRREITRLKDRFDKYIYSIDENEQEILTDLYNRRFNNIVLTSPDGSFLDFNDFDLKAENITNIYQHQKDAIWKMISNRGGIVDHEVGLGKTFTLIAESHFLKKFGICKKPIIICLNANTTDIVKSYKRLLPNANILYTDPKDFTPKKREQFLNQIRNNNWDAIIMTHTQFMAIPQSYTTQLEILRQELKDVENNLFAVNSMSEAEITKKQLQGLNEKKRNLSIKISDVLRKINDKKDKGVLDFSDLGIDHIIVDESHKFKNLEYQTRHTRVAGLGSSSSNRALNLLTAIRTLQKSTPNGELGASFYSGTPISNSLVELFLLQKYLIPKTLENRGVQNFDSWASIFAKKSVEFEANMVNDIVARERFRYFVNIPELVSMYCNIAHIMTGNRMGMDRPVKNEVLLLNEQSPIQRRFYKKLAKFLGSGDQLILNLENPVSDNKDALSLVTMNLAFKASLDMRLINGKVYKDEPNNKVSKMVEKVLNTYKAFDNEKGTQIIFCDTSVSKKKLSFEELEENYKNGIFTSIYDDIKYKLIKGGIAEDEIAFIQQYDTPEKKKALGDMMNDGKTRILIGGTDNAGTGLNVQKRLISVIHLTIPWKPSETEQRNGRGYRTGNWIAKSANDNQIDITTCATSNTLDAYKVDVNKNKAGFIWQVKEYAFGLSLDRTLDEGAIDESAGMNLAEMHAKITGDNTLLEKFKVDKKIKELEQEKMYILNEVGSAKNTIKKAEERKEELELIKSYCQKDLECYKKNVQYDEKGSRINQPKYFGLSEADCKDVDKVFSFLKKKKEDISRLKNNEFLVIGEMYGFELIGINSWLSGVNFSIRNKENPKAKYEITQGQMNTSDKSLATTYFIRCFDSIQRRIDANQKNIDKETALIKESYKKTLYSFEKEDELTKLKSEAEVLDKKLRQRKSDTFSLPKETIDGEEVSIIDSIETFEKALEDDLVGREGENNYLIVDDDTKEAIERLNDNVNSTLEILYNQEYFGYNNGEKRMNLITFTVIDNDKMFVEYYVEKQKNYTEQTKSQQPTIKKPSKMASAESIDMLHKIMEGKIHPKQALEIMQKKKQLQCDSEENKTKMRL